MEVYTMNNRLTTRQRKKLEYWAGVKDAENFAPDVNDNDLAVLMDRVEKELKDPAKVKALKDHLVFSVCVATMKYITDIGFTVPHNVLAQTNNQDGGRSTIEGRGNHRKPKHGHKYKRNNR